MYLSRIEEKMLSGEFGEVTKKAMEIIVKVGEVFGAERLIDIAHAHISGVSYFNIGDEGLEFLTDLSQKGAKTRVYTTANPYSFAGLSLYNNEELNRKQIQIIEALIKIGIDPNSFTCIPYALRKPAIGEHLAWAESSAVIYANSVLGAFTNREGGITALMAALIGKTYDSGMHRIENRTASEEIIIEFNINSILLASLLGLHIGRLTRGVPYIKAKYSVEKEAMFNLLLKNMLASIASTSSASMAILDGITPPNTYIIDSSIERIHIDEKELYQSIDNMLCKSDALLLGCPHLTQEEMLMLLRDEYIDIFKKHGISKIIVTVGANLNIRSVEISNIINKIRERHKINVEIMPGSCAVVSNLRLLNMASVYTPHGKAIHYLYNLSGAKPCIIGV
ncbi:MAG: aconitase X [Ignisphaera sp.]